MPNTTLPVDIHAVVNSLIAQAGGGALAATDTSSMITVAQAAQIYGHETLLNALSLQIGRTLIAIRPYDAEDLGVEVDNMTYGQISRKISYYSNDFEAEQSWNTAASGAGYNLKDGASVDHYKIKKQYPLEMHFGGNKVLQKHITRWLYQLDVAFRSSDDLARFIAGLAVENQNEISMMKEARNRAILLNFIAGLYNVGTARSKVNLTKEYNTKYGTSVTSAQLRDMPQFFAFLVSRIKYDSDMMAKNTELFHLTPAKTDDLGNALHLYRHTPKSEQRLCLLSPLLYDSEANVLPQVFHDGYLKLDNYRSIAYWQSAENGKEGSINVTPNQLKVADGTTVKGAAVTKPYIVGLMYDRAALMSTYRLDRTITTPDNAGGAYVNTYYHWANDFTNDFTENAILYYMEDDAA
ncbi:MAG: hypothetical protein KIH02_09065 [Parabacteroides sp.]|nr:hypothetical protein [Parabacteroides sp.]